MKNLATALLKAQQEMGVALKDSANPFFKSKFADLNSVIDAAVPVLNANGIVVTQLVEISETGLSSGQGVTSMLSTVFIHAASGESIKSSVPIVCAKQNDPQAMGSAISYARRYGLQAMGLIKAEDDDGHKGSGKEAVSSKTTPTATPQAKLAPAVMTTVKKPGSFAATKTTAKEDVF